MIDKYKDCTTKSKLAIKVKTVSKYNDRSRVAAKQTNKQTQKNRNRKTYLKNKKTYSQIDAEADLLQAHTQTEVNKK